MRFPTYQLTMFSQYIALPVCLYHVRAPLERRQSAAVLSDCLIVSFSGSKQRPRTFDLHKIAVLR